MDAHVDWTARYSLMIHRYRFLQAVERWVPKALEDLALNAFPLFEALFEREPSGTVGESAIIIWDRSGVGRAGFWITFRATRAELAAGRLEALIEAGPSWASEFECGDLEPNRAVFKEAVERWACTYNLDAAWVKEEVFSTVRFWLQPGCPRVTWKFRGPDPAEGAPALPRLHIDEQWSGESWAVDKTRLLARINAFGSEIKKHNKLMGLYRGETRTRTPDHYRWAAVFQCGKGSPKRIAESTERVPRLDQSTVSKAIDSVLDTIGLAKRRRMSGRIPIAKT